MNKTRNTREASVLPKLQPFFPQAGMAAVTRASDRDRHPKARITGDMLFSLAEQEVARGPITGHYTVVVEDMEGPLFVLWRAQNGAVLNCSARSTAIAFDLSEVCAGQHWTSEIMVQMTDAVTYDTVVSGTFVQALVTSNRLLERTAWQLEGTQALSERQCQRRSQRLRSPMTSRHSARAAGQP